MSYKERAHPAEIKIEKSKIHFSKEPIDVSNVDIERILESNKHFFGKKTLSENVVLRIMIKYPKLSTYVNI